MDIDDDERQRDRPQPPSARRVGAGRAHLFVAPPRRCLDIDSSSRLDLGSVALPTNAIVFVKVSTKLRRGSKGAENEELGLSGHPR